MKTKYIFGFYAFAIFFLEDCKKDNAFNQSLIIGKWYENKLTITQTNTTNSTTTDTTFLSSNFTKGDFFNFSPADTASIWTDGSYFTLKGKFFVTYPTEQELLYRSYEVKGSSLILQVGFIPTCLGCSQPGPDTVKILQLDEHNLVLQQQSPDTSKMFTGNTITYYIK
jgi:hypothetical protein